MGEAKRKKSRLDNWRATLSSRDKIVVTVAERLYPVLPPFGACYRATLFLKYHLLQRHGIEGEAVIGYTNDGTDDLYSSHGWYELEGRITDLAVSRPLHPEIQKCGPILILGEIVKDGWAYTYHRTMPDRGRDEFEQMRNAPGLAGRMAELEQIHRTMAETAENLDAIRTYLDGCDDGMSYEWLARAVERP